ncbi:hypothetical protein TTHERM_00197670 (macronuclear) [Tetrahymena thermophila SB210]|uniref:Uncharacterized protein n=1 Tax=Tetrahymena thermophila (strain SB210) TaxID=312017 RepID=Q22NT2_TETTS|nr:hypothetical protein TTHERM_00197670 [Tetrahymena thermophila SB210]EAR86703.2 hypothetical protein TTHERM_00197670 [Tetrahymena thermophila SB210]|eukprot:XP_977298.2 hypothetical protein TTHERM_00197670 [Tetrahymena thermophila SB210]
MNVLNSNNQNAKFQSYPEQPSSDLETLLQQKLNQQEQLKMKPEGEDLFLKSVHYQLAGLKSKNQTQISNNESLSFQIGLKLENKEIIKSAYKDESKINSRDQNLSKQQNQGILNQGKLINISQVNQNNLLHFDDQNEFSLFQGQNSNKFEDILATKQSQLKKQKLQVKEITNNLNVRDHSLNKTRVNNLKQQEKKVYK